MGQNPPLMMVALPAPTLETESPTQLRYLVRFIEEHAEVGEHNPKLLPPVAVLEFPQEVSRQLILKQIRSSQIRQ